MIVLMLLLIFVVPFLEVDSPERQITSKLASLNEVRLFGSGELYASQEQRFVTDFGDTAVFLRVNHTVVLDRLAQFEGYRRVDFAEYWWPQHISVNEAPATFLLSKREENRDNATLGIISTSFVLFLLAFGSLVWYADANRLGREVSLPLQLLCNALYDVLGVAFRETGNHDAQVSTTATFTCTQTHIQMTHTTHTREHAITTHREALLVVAIVVTLCDCSSLPRTSIHHAYKKRHSRTHTHTHMHTYTHTHPRTHTYNRYTTGINC
jgi:hypothetical protein